MKSPWDVIWLLFLTLCLLGVIGWFVSSLLAWLLLTTIIIGCLADFVSYYQSKKKKGVYYGKH